MSYHVCVSFSTFFSFLPIIQTYSAHFSFFTLFSVSHHNPVIQSLCLIFHGFFLCVFFHLIPGPTGCISHFSCFSMFLFHISCSKVCVSQFPRFSIFSAVTILKCPFLIFLTFHCFSPNSRSYSVFFSL